MSHVTPSITTLFDRYLEIWNETDPERRRREIDDVWADDARYRDPVLSGDGREGIDSMTAGFQAAYPGHTFARQGEVRPEGTAFRFEWNLRNAEGEIQIVGTDIAEVDASGQLRSITGTFEV